MNQEQDYNSLFQHAPIEVMGIKTSKKEIIDLAKAGFMVSIAFVIFTGQFKSTTRIFLAASVFVLSFLLHELAHKIIAQRYKCWAEFRSFDIMLILAVVFSFFGILFAAPGAVMILGKVTKKRNGIISIAGPLTNLVLAVVFLFVALIPYNTAFWLGTLGFLINAWLGLFNLLPFWNFDGAKILHWSKPTYFIILFFGMLIFAMQYFVPLANLT